MTAKEKLGSVLNGVGELVTPNMEKAGVLSGFFTLVLTGKNTLQESHVPKTSQKAWSKEDLPSLKVNQVKERFKKLNTDKSV